MKPIHLVIAALVLVCSILAVTGGFIWWYQGETGQSLSLLGSPPRATVTPMPGFSSSTPERSSASPTIPPQSMPSIRPASPSPGPAAQSARSEPGRAAQGTGWPAGQGTGTLTPTAEPTTPPPPVPPSPEGPPIVVVPGPGTPTPTPLFAADLPPDVVNVVLLGTDLRAPGQPWRTDTIILVSIDRWNRTVSLLSIPRDLWVYMPEVGYGRINTADFWGGFNELKGGGTELLKRTIEHNLGIQVHRYARVDFNGFVSIVDTLGGITVDVDCPIRDTFTGFTFEAGVQHMDGKTALQYVQSRYTTSDFDRARRQQKALRAIFDKVLDLNLLPNIPHLWSAIRDTVSTDLSMVEVVTLAYFGARLRPEHLRARVLAYPAVHSWLGPGGAQVLLLNEGEFNQVRDEFLHPPDALAEAQALEEATVAVLNGTSTETLAELAVAYLQRQGFDAVAGGPADRRDCPATAIILVNPEKTATAGRLAQALGVDPENVTVFRDPTTTADVRVILGQNYQPCGR